MVVLENETTFQTHEVGLRVANLTLNYEAGSFPIDLDFSPSQLKFSTTNLAEVEETSAFSTTLSLTLTHDVFGRNCSWSKLLCRTEIWELWLNDKGSFVLYNPRQPLLRQVIVDPDFRVGLLLGNFLENREVPIRPLSQDMEIVFYVNWLATIGDVILHASGVACDGKGYVFAGVSHVGKSTLAASLAADPSITVLGEDQVILRLIDGQFRVYGTPWHINPEMCSPLGVPLEKIFFLEKKNMMAINNISATDGVARLMTTAFVPYYRPKAVNMILERFTILSGQHKFHTLSYPLGAPMWDVIQSI